MKAQARPNMANTQTASSLAEKREQLLNLLRGLESCAVAMSAGVDSAVVAKAAFLALGDRAVAVTGVSASLASGEIDQARNIAALIGIRHETIVTDEFASEAYTRNAPDRCFHCKTELYTQMGGLAERLGGATVVLVKSCRIDRSASPARLAKAGIVDAAFAEIVERAHLPWRDLGKGDEPELARLLGAKHRSGRRRPAKRAIARLT